MQTRWKSILHHVADQHEWLDYSGEGACQHGAMQLADSNKPVLAKGSPAWQKLRDVVLDQNLLKELKYYVDFQ